MTKKSDVHRDINLTSPLATGADVKALQKRLNEYAKKHPNLTRFHLSEDGQFGEHSFHAAVRVANLIGLTNKRLKEMGAKHVVTEETQRNILHPHLLTAKQRSRGKKRRKALKKQHKAHDKGAAAAVKYAREHLGTTESPPGSNGGGLIDTWEQFWGLGHVFWCGCFAGYCVKKIGGAAVDSWLPYSGSIDADARAGVRGLQAVSVNDARAGDIVTFRFEGTVSDHIGLCVGPTVGGEVHTIDGNTSAADGSQSNGGGVFEKKRPVSYVVTVARPNYGG